MVYLIRFNYHIFMIYNVSIKIDIIINGNNLG